MSRRNTPDAKALVHALICGADYRTSVEALVTQQQLGVDAILDAFETPGIWPKDRHPIDVHDDLGSVLQVVVAKDCSLLIDALNRRPKHSSSLIWALGATRDKRAVQALIEATHHKEKWTRWAAVSGLVRLKRKSFLPIFIARLKDRSSDVAFVALEGIAAIGDKSAIEPLEKYRLKKQIGPGAHRIATETLDRLKSKRKSPGNRGC